MKIAQVTATFPPNITGTGNVCYYNSLELARLGHDVTVFTSNYPKSEYRYPEILRVKRLHPLFRVGNGPFLPGLLKMGKFDIVHLHYPFFFGSEMIYLRSKLGHSGYILTYHNDLIGDGWMKHIFSAYNHISLKQVVNNATKILVHSFDFACHSKIRQIVENRMKDVVELPNGVDIDNFNPSVSGEGIREKFGLDDSRVILFVGTLDRAHYFKGVEYLLQSLSKLKDKDVQLLIIGEGNLKNHYIAMAGKMGVLSKTKFAGEVFHDELPEYYAASDIVVLPSFETECFGLTLVEAMACGRAVISSNLPGVRTVVDHDKNGLLVEPKNVEALTSKINYLLENEDLRVKFGKKGRIKAMEKYSWRRIGQKLEEIYLGTVDG